MTNNTNKALTIPKKQGRTIGSLESRDATIWKETSKMMKLYLQGVTCAEIGKLTNKPTSTVHKRVTTFLNMFQSLKGELENLNTLRESKAELFEAGELKLLKSMVDDSRLEKAAPNQLAYAARQLFDMRQITQGKSTQNIAHIHQFTNVELPKQRDRLN